MIGLYIGIGIIIVLAIWIISTYNKFVKKKLSVENNFSQIKIQCKKRFDLIPNLVECVKGYASHEKDALQNVIEARNKGASATNPKELANANGELSQFLSRLFALGEAYPDLKANTNFLSLQTELSDLEKAIAVARQIYNDSVMIFNREIMVFPNNVIAGMFNFTRADFFETPEEETQNISVSF